MIYNNEYYFCGKEKFKICQIKIENDIMPLTITVWSIHDIFADGITYTETHFLKVYFRKTLLAWMFYYKGHYFIVYVKYVLKEIY